LRHKTFAGEIKRFRDLLQTNTCNKICIEQLCQDAFKLTPLAYDHGDLSGKPIRMTFMALTHGNEIAGIAVLNKFLEQLFSGFIDLKYPIAVVLGNPEAALSDVRFLEKDLNRCFASVKKTSLEEKRAKQLEPILNDSEFLVDFHQTIEKTLTPFFIFPFHKLSFSFARMIEAELPIITHWSGKFSKEGSCTDEYVHSKGGVAITIELGQKGFDVYQESLGLMCVIRALHAPLDLKWQNDYQHANDRVYTWGQVIAYPEGDAQLDQGWYNFKQVQAGQRLGHSEFGEIVSDASGPILFPKYGTYQANSKPKEICRVLRPVTSAEIEGLIGV
jgi:succinylglutamate desuccinylase